MTIGIGLVWLRYAVSELAWVLHYLGMATDFILNDGGRAAAGYKGSAGDCVTRSIAIASGLPYVEVYKAIAQIEGSRRGSKKGATARDGVNTRRHAFKAYMQSIGFTWTPTMLIGSGCKVHLRSDELPSGRLVVAVSKHYTAVINGVIHDVFDPREDRDNGRCVYGYWTLTNEPR